MTVSSDKCLFDECCNGTVSTLHLRAPSTSCFLCCSATMAKRRGTTLQLSLLTEWKKRRARPALWYRFSTWKTQQVAWWRRGKIRQLYIDFIKGGRHILKQSGAAQSKPSDQVWNNSWINACLLGKGPGSPVHILSTRGRSRARWLRKKSASASVLLVETRRRCCGIWSTLPAAPRSPRTRTPAWRRLAGDPLQAG